MLLAVAGCFGPCSCASVLCCGSAAVVPLSVLECAFQGSPLLHLFLTLRLFVAQGDAGTEAALFSCTANTACVFGLELAHASVCCELRQAVRMVQHHLGSTGNLGSTIPLLPRSLFRNRIYNIRTSNLLLCMHVALFLNDDPVKATTIASQIHLPAHSTLN